MRVGTIVAARDAGGRRGKGSGDRNRAETGREGRAVELERQYTDVDGHRFHSVQAGAGEPVVLLHGLAGSYRWWRYTLPDLTDRFRVYAPELIGFGSSRPVRRAPTGIGELAELLLAWLDAQAIERTHLIGHSMGGQISIHLAAKWPARIARLVLVSSAGIPRRLPLPEVTRLLSEVIPPRAWGRTTFLPTIARDALRAGPRTILRAGYQILSDDVRPLLACIESPTLLVWGRLDPLTPLSHAWQLADGIPGARLEVIPNAAHNPMVDQPHRFIEVVRAFLLGDGDAA